MNTKAEILQAVQDYHNGTFVRINYEYSNYFKTRVVQKVLEYKELKLEEPKADEVTINNHAIGLNYIDTYHRSGLYPLRSSLFYWFRRCWRNNKNRLWSKKFKVGDKVAYCAAPVGAYSTHRNYPTKSLVKVPEELN